MSKPAGRGLDAVLIYGIAAVGGVGAVGLLLAPWLLVAAEDAVILFQFSRNLARTGAITWITNGPRAEGATDFGWMVAIAGGMRLGLAPWVVASILSFVSLFGLGALLLRLANRPVRPLPLLFLAGCFALMPQFVAAGLGFSVLPFACLLVLLVLCFVRESDIGMPLAALALCLLRPDGAVFAVPLLLAALVIFPRRLRRLALEMGLFVLPGCAYFLWRWHYFGQFWPLPFLVKVDTDRVAHWLVIGSWREAWMLLAFAAVLLLAGLRRRLDRKSLLVLLCIVLLPNVFYLAMRLDQNIGLRFFLYPVLGAAMLLAMNFDRLTISRSVLLRVGCVAWVLLLLRPWFAQGHLSWTLQMHDRVAIAQEMSQLPHGTLLTTEAGVVPYYSEWPSYDAWGLNTPEFATRLIQPADVAPIDPDVILLYTGGEMGCVAQPDWQTPYRSRTFQHMNRNLVAGAGPERYQLWLLPFGRRVAGGKPWDGDHECWLVRRDSPLRERLEGVLRAHRGITGEVFLEHVRLSGGKNGG